MLANSHRLIRSEEYTFYIGPDKKLIIVHAGAIAAISKILDNIINDRSETSKERHTTWRKILVDDFVRFCEYAYRGDYTAPLRSKWNLMACARLHYFAHCFSIKPLKVLRMLRLDEVLNHLRYLDLGGSAKEIVEFARQVYLDDNYFPKEKGIGQK